MSILAPLFLVGMIAIALPIWLHRLQTRSPERKPFSSAMLLEQSEQQTHLKKQLRYLALLALRIALLMILVLAFSKPLWERPARFLGGEGSVLHLIAIDTSFSMGYGNWFENARLTATRLIDEMADVDRALILSAGNSIEVHGVADNNRSELKRTVAGLTVDSGRMDMGMLISSLNSIIREYQQNTLIHIVSDFQASGLPPRFADLIPDSSGSYITGLELYPLAGTDSSNLYVDSILRTEAGLDVGVRGFDNELVEIRLALRINDILHEEITGVIPEAGQSVFRFSVPVYESGDNRIEATILNGDDLPGDNTRYAVVDNTPPRPVLLITANTQSLPVRYLTAAVEAAQQGYRVEPVSVNEIDPRIIQRYSWLLIDDLGIVNESLATVIGEYLDEGGAVLAAVGDRAQSRTNLPIVGYPVNPTILSAAIMSPHTVARIDSSHPVLAETSGWRDIHVSRLLTLDTGAGAHSLINLDNGAPLLLEYRRGRGQLLLLTSSLDNTWSDLPIRPVFVNFVAEAAKYLSGSERLQRHQTVGDYLRLGQAGAAAGQVIDPDGRTILSLADTHRSQEIRLNQTGFYEIYTSDAEVLVAVNPDLRESDLTIMPAEALARWQEAVAGAHVSGETSGQIEVGQDPLELWHILLVLLGLVILAESILGNRYLASGKGYN